jgi:hypothetical protein
MKQSDVKDRDSKEMSTLFRACGAVFMFGSAVMLTVGLFFPETPVVSGEHGKRIRGFSRRLCA